MGSRPDPWKRFLSRLHHAVPGWKTVPRGLCSRACFYVTYYMLERGVAVVETLLGILAGGLYAFSMNRAGQAVVVIILLLATAVIIGAFVRALLELCWIRDVECMIARGASLRATLILTYQERDNEAGKTLGSKCITWQSEVHDAIKRYRRWLSVVDQSLFRVPVDDRLFNDWVLLREWIPRIDADCSRLANAIDRAESKRSTHHDS